MLSELLTVENVDGALVGGASLKAEEFLAIAGCLPLSRTAATRPWKNRVGSCRDPPGFLYREHGGQNRKRTSIEMLTVIIVIHLMIVVAMIGVVLLQKSEGGGLVSSSNSGFMTGRGTANVLTRTTAVLAVGFFVTSLALSWLAGLGRHPASIINTGAGRRRRAMHRKCR